MNEVKKFFLIETLAWKWEDFSEREKGFNLLGYHIARMSKSANDFRIPFDRQKLEEELYQTGYKLLEKGETIQKIRITLDGRGKLAISCQKFPPTPDLPVKIDISPQRVKSCDTFLYHKTNKRRLFDLERKRLKKAGTFETIFLNEHGELTQGTITNLFLDKDKGILETPALACGLLPGTLRQHLLDTRKAVETILTTDDLLNAKRIFVGNSLRGLLEAKLV